MDAPAAALNAAAAARMSEEREKRTEERRRRLQHIADWADAESVPYSSARLSQLWLGVEGDAHDFSDVAVLKFITGNSQTYIQNYVRFVKRAPTALSAAAKWARATSP